MTISFVLLESNAGGPSGANVSGSLTIPNGDLVLLASTNMDIGGAPGGNSTPTGTGASGWAQLGVSLVNSDTSRRHSLWCGVGTGTASTITFGASGQEATAYTIVRVAGADTSRGAGGVRQALTLSSTIPSGTTIDTTALAPLLASSATFLTIGGNDGFTGSIDQPAVWTELSDILTPTNIIAHESCYKVAGETHPQAAINGATGLPAYVSIVAEILDPISAVEGQYAFAGEFSRRDL